MSSQPLSQTNSVQFQIADAPLRELSFDELQQVSGGLPNGTWAVPVAGTTTATSGPTDLPNGSW